MKIYENNQGCNPLTIRGMSHQVWNPSGKKLMQTEKTFILFLEHLANVYSLHQFAMEHDRRAIPATVLVDTSTNKQSQKR